MNTQLLDLHLEKPEAVLMAQGKKKGMNLFLEIIVFVLVFFVCSFAQILIMAPGELILLSQNADYQAAVTAGDSEGAMQAANLIAGSDIYMIMMLFSTIAMIAITLLFCRIVQKRGPETLGFTRSEIGREYLIGLGAGFVMFSGAVLISVLTGSVRIDGISETFSGGIFLLFMFGYVIQGMGEEVLCRGYVMVSIGRRYSMWVAVFSNALIFAALHLMNSGISVLAFINLTLFGVFASLFFIKRGSIWGIAAFHSIWNLVQGNFWGLRVSGNSVECSVLKSTLAESRSLINGGAFGPEGGLGVSIVLLVGICMLLVRKDKSGSR